LVRLSVSDENYNDARVAFIKYNNWSHVAIIHQDSIEHSLVNKKKKNVFFLILSLYSDDGTISETLK
jgi:hypothetical protein